MNFRRLILDRRPCLALATLALLAMLPGGCLFGHKDPADEPPPMDPPPFLLGPATALLTNAAGYRARFAVPLPASVPPAKPLAGLLLVQGAQMMFVPDHSDVAFTWDAGAHSGFALLGPLQGTAPLKPGVIATNCQIVPEAKAAVRINGVSCRREDVAFQMADGTVASFEVWCSADTDSFPVEIKSVAGLTPFVLDLTRIEPASFPPDQFRTPDGFTSYASFAAMRDELLRRRARARAPGATPSLDNSTNAVDNNNRNR